MSDPKPNIEGPSPTGSPTEASVEATNSQIGNVSQVVNSPGAVVNQFQIDQSSSAVPGILAGMFGVLLLLLVGVLPLLGKAVPSGLALALLGVSVWLIVGGFFSWVESLLNQATKSEMADWLLGANVGQKVEPWPDTFAKIFDRVFGKKLFSWKCFWRSCVTSASLFIVVITVRQPFSLLLEDRSTFYKLGYTYRLSALALPLLVVTNFVPDYLSLVKSRWILAASMRTVNALAWVAWIVTDVIVSACLCAFAFFVLVLIDVSFPEAERSVSILVTLSGGRPWLILSIYPALFASIWLWLYVGSGFLVKAARRFDIGFRWFNRRFDIAKKPLQAIGLVAGALVALLYWAAVIVNSFTHHA